MSAVPAAASSSQATTWERSPWRTSSTRACHWASCSAEGVGGSTAWESPRSCRQRQHGLATLPGEYQRDRAVNLARLAVAHAASQEPELACAVAQETAVIVHGTWSARAVAELRRLPTLLSSWPDLAAVAELEATLAALP